MIVKARVLDGEDRVLHYWRNLVVLERDPFLQREFANLRLAVVGVDAGNHAGAISRQRGDFVCRARIVKFVSSDDARQPAGGQRQQQDCRQPQAAQDVPTLRGRGLRNRSWRISL